jgi:NAD(P)-dependent dehydrogenase (short-subunit alcohol dehydrogenase family)
MRMTGKVAVVTGGASGNGLAIAERLAQEGASVLIGDINEPALDQAVAGIRGAGGTASGMRCDVSNEADVEALMAAAETLGGPHALVAQAGFMFESTLEQTPLADWERHMAVDVRGTFLCAKAAIPRMRALGGGSIVCMSGTYAFQVEPGVAASATAKGAILAMTRSIAVENGIDAIRCNCIAPGYIDTPMVARWAEAQPDPEEARRSASEMHALGRMGTAQEIAAMAAFLCSDESSFCTGQCYFVDGGLTSGSNAFQYTPTPIR